MSVTRAAKQQLNKATFQKACYSLKPLDCVNSCTHTFISPCLERELVWMHFISSMCGLKRSAVSRGACCHVWGSFVFLDDSSQLRRQILKWWDGSFFLLLYNLVYSFCLLLAWSASLGSLEFDNLDRCFQVNVVHVVNWKYGEME